MNGRWAFGPMSGPIASISILAPMAAAFFICSTVMLTTSNSAWVTTTRSTPMSRGVDDRQHLRRGGMAGAEDELLLGADLEDLAERGERLAVGADHLDPLRRVLEVLDVVVGVEGRQPHHAAVAALHPPHPLHGLGVDPARGTVERDTAERLDPGIVLAGEPRPVRG